MNIHITKFLNTLFIITLVFVSSNHINSQSPHLSGNVYLDIEQGLFKCNLELSNFPLTENPAIVLNKGMNIKDVVVNGVSVGYNLDWGVAFQNPFLVEGIGISLNDTITTNTKIRISYTGAFPIYEKDEFTANGDGMSAITIKNNILRASHQTLWYPILFDRETKTLNTKVSYDLEFKISSKKSFYITGSKPKKVRKYHVKSSQENDLLLYVGDYNFNTAHNIHFLNTQLDKVQEEKIGKRLIEIEEYYKNLLTDLGQQDIALAQIFSKGPKNQYANWAFVVYPAIVADLNQLVESINDDSGKINDINIFRIYSHELAHKYFGLHIKSNNIFWGFFSESFAEYLSLRYIKEFYGNTIFSDFLNKRYFSDRLLKKSFIQLNEVESDINNTHKYYYYPMLLIALEHFVGAEKMNKFLKHFVMTTKTNQLNYEYLKAKALESGIDKTQWEEFESKYIFSNNALQLIKSSIKK